MMRQLANGWQRSTQTLNRQGILTCDRTCVVSLKYNTQCGINHFTTSVDAAAIASGIDLTRYPLHNFASAEMQKIISDARSQLMSTG